MPTYRRPQLLRRAVLSILNQSYGDLAVWILDNASGDETEQVAGELMAQDDRVRYHRHPVNVGSLSNMIYGIEHVTTPFFSILCDDDLLMPGFLGEAMGIHARADERLAFVSAPVVVVDEQGRFADPWPHPATGCRLSPPDGVARCLRAGLALTGVVYRTSAMRVIGPPRFAWWNWTESGWHALVGARFEMAFSSEVGAVVFNHLDSNSKQMDRSEFHVSWFDMLAEVREAVTATGVGDAWWRRQVLPLAYRRLLFAVVRLAMADDAAMFGRLRRVGIAAGMRRGVVGPAVALGRLARALRLGGLFNSIMDTWRPSPTGAGRGRSGQAQDDTRLATAAQVFFTLNRQAGLGEVHSR